MDQPDILKSYRVYELAPDGRIISGDWLEAADDNAAILHIEERRSDLTIELWDGNRKVKKINPPSDREGAL